MPPTEERYLLLEVAGRSFAIPVGDIQEIVPLAALSQAPGQPPLLEGFLNLRGEAAPVIHAARLLDLPAREPAKHTPLVILRCNPPLALLVDRALEIASPREVLPLQGNSSFNDCATAEAVFAGCTAPVLDCSRLLLEKERRAVEAMQARARERILNLEDPPA